MSDETLRVTDEDPVGQETLELFAKTDHFNEWMFENLSLYCRDNILEIGSGIGNISSLLLKKFSEVHLSDLRMSYCEKLKSRFSGDNRLKGVYRLDLGEKEIEKKYPALINSFNSIIASNVVEHIEDDGTAVENCCKLLMSGGRLIVLVPAYDWLFNGFDKELGHFRRYNKKTLSALMEGKGLSILHSQYFNAAGIAGWWFSGSVLKKKILPKNQLNFYNKLIPLIRLVDQVVLHKTGLSVIAVGEKK
ncbi:MAG: class I SAM-dependent methyltransferase [Bacteroidetes bacterium]|nr:MAG: class I SAM-dependent methyltransferase [Bacteroidota bacterium]